MMGFVDEGDPIKVWTNSCNEDIARLN